MPCRQDYKGRWDGDPYHRGLQPPVRMLTFNQAGLILPIYPPIRLPFDLNVDGVETGGSDFTRKKQSYDADPFITSEAIHWLICLESYEKPGTRRKDVENWLMMYSDPETCIYQKNDRVIIAFRGTSEPKDLYDDSLIVQGKIFPRAEEAIVYVRELKDLNPSVYIELTGHSLGGSIAQIVGSQLNLRSCTFNAAAPPTMPVVNNPNSVNYHIMFDVVSAWQSPCVRIDKGYRPKLSPWYSVVPYLWLWTTLKDILPAHSLVNFSNDIGGREVYTADENTGMRNWIYNIPYLGRIMLVDLLMGGKRGTSLPDIK